MAASPKRYTIYFANLNPAVGGEIRKVRPVVVVSQNEMNQLLETVASAVAKPTAGPMRRQDS